MRLIICFSLLFLSHVSFCQYKYIQILDVGSEHVPKEGEYYVYENDTMKITYAFWTKQGILAFQIYNKLDVPIYIDWKKSSFIHNTMKYNYWIDEEITKSLSVYGAYYSSNSYGNDYYDASSNFYGGAGSRPSSYQGTSKYEGSRKARQGISKEARTTVRIERITFIPPRSHYYRSQFHLMPLDFFDHDTKSITPQIAIKNGTESKKTEIYESTFTIDNSPLLFRNFVAVSLTEEFDTEFYIDNEFFVCRVRDMEYEHYKFYKRDEHGKIVRYKDGEAVYERPYRTKSSFYFWRPMDWKP